MNNPVTTSYDIALLLDRDANYISNKIELFRRVLPKPVFKRRFARLTNMKDDKLGHYIIYEISQEGIEHLSKYLPKNDSALLKDFVQMRSEDNIKNEFKQELLNPVVQPTASTNMTPGSTPKYHLMTDKEKDALYEDYKNGMRRDDLVTKYNSSRSTVSRIITEKGQVRYNMKKKDTVKPTVKETEVPNGTKNEPENNDSKIKTLKDSYSEIKTLKDFYNAYMTHKTELSYGGFALRAKTLCKLQKGVDYIVLKGESKNKNRHSLNFQEKVLTEQGIKKLLDHVDELCMDPKEYQKIHRRGKNKTTLENEARQDDKEIVLNTANAGIVPNYCSSQLYTTFGNMDKLVEVLQQIEQHLGVLAKSVQPTEPIQESPSPTPKPTRAHRPVAKWRQAANNKVRAIACAYAAQKNVSVDSVMKEVYNMLYNQLEQEMRVNIDQRAQQLSRERHEKVTRMDAVEASEELTKKYLQIVDEIYNTYFYSKNEEIA